MAIEREFVETYSELFIVDADLLEREIEATATTDLVALSTLMPHDLQ